MSMHLSIFVGFVVCLFDIFSLVDRSLNIDDVRKGVKIFMRLLPGLHLIQSTKIEIEFDGWIG